MKVSINHRCEGHGVCVDHAPTVFHLGDADETVTVIDSTPEQGLQAAVDEAAMACPMQAVQISS